MNPAMKPMMIYQRMCNIGAFFGGFRLAAERLPALVDQIGWLGDHGLLAAKKGKPDRIYRVAEPLLASRPVLHIFNFVFDVGCESRCLGLSQRQAGPAS